jgi:acetyl-CoA acyltransferase
VPKSFHLFVRFTHVSLTSLSQAWIGNFAGELFSSQGHLGTLTPGGMQVDLVTHLSVCAHAHQKGAALAGASPEFRFLPAMRVEGACASGGLAFASAGIYSLGARI